MANKLDLEARMTIKSLAGHGVGNYAMGRLLGVHENTIRYHRHRQEAGITEGRAKQPHLAGG